MKRTATILSLLCCCAGCAVFSPRTPPHERVIALEKEGRYRKAVSVFESLSYYPSLWAGHAACRAYLALAKNEPQDHRRNELFDKAFRAIPRRVRTDEPTRTKFRVLGSMLCGEIREGRAYTEMKWGSPKRASEEYSEALTIYCMLTLACKRIPETLPLIEEAYSRAIKLALKLAEPQEADELYKEYLQEFPEGKHVDALRRLVNADEQKQ